MRELWLAAGLVEVETRVISVQRRFASFHDYWETVLYGPSVGGQLRALSSYDMSQLQARIRALLPTDPEGRITCTARAHAVKGRTRVPVGHRTGLVTT